MIKLIEIQKRYSIKLALNKVTLSIEKNSIYCLLGKNGAGKTTLINILANLIEPTEGRVLINNLNYSEGSIKIKKDIGVMCEANYLIEELSGFEYLSFVGSLYKIDKSELNKRINGLINYFFEITTDVNIPIMYYSTGMKKKIMLCSALLNKPNILILDEPFSSLDPYASNLLVNLLKKYNNGNRAMLISSHNINYVEQIATHIGVIDEGKILFNGEFQTFIENGEKNINDSLMEILNKTPKNVEDLEWML